MKHNERGNKCLDFVSKRIIGQPENFAFTRERYVEALCISTNFHPWNDSHYSPATASNMQIEEYIIIKWNENYKCNWLVGGLIV
jgi:hypothetical protein